VGWTTTSLKFQDPKPAFTIDMAQVESRSMIANARVVVPLCDGRVAMACTLPADGVAGLDRVTPARLVFLDTTNGQMIGHMVVDPDLVCKLSKATATRLSYETWAVTVNFARDHDPIIFEINVQTNTVDDYEFVREVKDVGVPAAAAPCAIAGVFEGGAYVHTWPTVPDGTRWAMLTRAAKADLGSTMAVEVKAGIGAVLHADATHVLAICDGLPAIVERKTGQVNPTPLWAPKGERADAIPDLGVTWSVSGEGGIIAVVLESPNGRRLIAMTIVNEKPLAELQWVCTNVGDLAGMGAKSRVTIPAIHVNGMVLVWAGETAYIGVHYAEQHLSERAPGCPGYLRIKILMSNPIPESPFLALVEEEGDFVMRPEELLNPMEVQEMYTRVRPTGQPGRKMNLGALVSGIRDARNQRDEYAHRAKIGEELTAGLINELESKLATAEAKNKEYAAEMKGYKDLVDTMSTAQQTMVGQIAELKEKEKGHKKVQNECAQLRTEMAAIRTDLAAAKTRDQDALLRALMADESTKGVKKGKRAKSASAASAVDKSKQDKTIARLQKERDTAIHERAAAIRDRDAASDARRQAVIELEKGRALAEEAVAGMTRKVKALEEAIREGADARRRLQQNVTALRKGGAATKTATKTATKKLEAELAATKTANAALATELDAATKGGAAAVAAIEVKLAVATEGRDELSGQNLALNARLIDAEAELHRVCTAVMGVTQAPNIEAGLYAFSQMGFDLVSARNQLAAFHAQFGIPYVTEVWVPPAAHPPPSAPSDSEGGAEIKTGASNRGGITAT